MEKRKKTKKLVKYSIISYFAILLPLLILIFGFTWKMIFWAITLFIIGPCMPIYSYYFIKDWEKETQEGQQKFHKCLIRLNTGLCCLLPIVLFFNISIIFIYRPLTISLSTFLFQSVINSIFVIIETIVWFFYIWRIRRSYIVQYRSMESTQDKPKKKFTIYIFFIYLPNLLIFFYRIESTLELILLIFIIISILTIPSIKKSIYLGSLRFMLKKDLEFQVFNDKPSVEEVNKCLSFGLAMECVYPISLCLIVLKIPYIFALLSLYLKYLFDYIHKKCGNDVFLDIFNIGFSFYLLFPMVAGAYFMTFYDVIPYIT